MDFFLEPRLEQWSCSTFSSQRHQLRHKFSNRHHTPPMLTFSASTTSLPDVKLTNTALSTHVERRQSQQSRSFGSTSSPTLPGLKAEHRNTRLRADPNKVWRASHEIACLPLPPLAKGMSRHRCPIGTKQNTQVQAAAVSESKLLAADINVAGRDALGHKEWWRGVFEAVDGNSNGHLTPAEFGALQARMEAELGTCDFNFNFNDADTLLDGRVSMQEWKAYAAKVETAIGKPRCLMAAWRFLGRRKAAAAKQMKSIFVHEGYNPDSSLQLLTACSKAASDKSKAAGDSLYAIVRKAVEQQADPNAALASVSYNGYTPLIFLALADSIKDGEQIAACINLLISVKADVHRESEISGALGRLLPLRVAAQLQNQKGLEELLKHVDVGDKFQWAAGEHVEHVMLEELAKICTSQTLCKIADKAQYNAQATILLIMYASPLVQSKLSPKGAQKLLSGLFEGVDSNENVTVQRTMAANPNGVGINGITALMQVAQKGDLETVKVLLEGKASPSLRDAEGATALHFASAGLHSGVVKALLAAQADPSVTDHAGFSAWMLVGESKSTKQSDNQREEVLVKDSLAREEILAVLRPRFDPEKIVNQLLDDWEVLLEDDNGYRAPSSATSASPFPRKDSVIRPTTGFKPKKQGADPVDFLTQKLRLHESLFFDPRMIACNTCEGRAPRKEVLDRVAEVLMDFLQSDPLKGDKKKLTKYLLQATMGPKYNLACSHLQVPWPVENNRAAYDVQLRVLVSKLLDGFGEDCDQFRDIIVGDADENPGGVCASLLALPADRVDVPDEWQQNTYWQDADFWRCVQEKQILRFDPEWALSIEDGATCCLALLRLGRVEDLAEYSSLLQVHHRPMELLLAEGYITYSELCNKRFQDLMCSVVRGVVSKTGVNVTFPREIVGVKKLKRLSEKTADARLERGLLEWPGRRSTYLAYSHCFYVLDTVRMSFICNGETVQDEVACCLELLNGFKSCTLEKNGLQLLRQKSGFAQGVRGSGGYADVKLLLYADLGESENAFLDTKIPLKIIGEVQIILNCYQQVKDRMHLAYEINRNSFGELPDLPTPRENPDPEIPEDEPEETECISGTLAELRRSLTAEVSADVEADAGVADEDETYEEADEPDEADEPEDTPAAAFLEG